MTSVEQGRLEQVAKRRGTRQRHAGHDWRPRCRPPADGLRTELVISVVLAAWAMVLLCGYIAGAVP
jgi:hypothetical protein